MIVNFKGVDARVPDFLIVGAPRSGTTAVYAHLSRHPQIFMPEEKEPMFLAVYGQDWAYVDARTGKKASYIFDNLADYLDLFRPAKDGQMIGEASTWYLYKYQTSIRNIKDIYGPEAANLKILILLRDPAERAWSHYWLKRRNGEEDLPFDQAIQPEIIRQRLERHYVAGFDYLGFGRYYQSVKNYLESFAQVKVMLFEEMIRDLSAGMSEISEFLGLTPLGAPKVNEKRLNVAGAPKSRLSEVLGNFIYRPSALKSVLKGFVPYRVRANLKYRLAKMLFHRDQLESERRKYLVEIYREDILALAPLISRNLDDWLAPAMRET
jgi:hypothetical protein